MKTVVIALATTVVFLTGCVLPSSVPPASGGAGVQTGVVYDSSHQLSLDVYQPQGVQDAPLVVFFYGDRWQHGTRAEYAYVGQALAARGFVAMVAEYRMYPPATWKEFLGDSAGAVVWARKHAAEYGADPDKLFVMGYSAGAYNAVMLGLDPQWLKAAGGSRSQLAGVIGISGPYDFVPITAPDLRTIFWPPSGFAKTQPVYWADGHNPPMLLIASRANKVANPADTEKLYNRIKQAGGPVTKLFYQGLSNSDTVRVLAIGRQDRADEMKNIAAFIHNTPAASPTSQPGISTQPARIDSISTLPAPTVLVAPAPAQSVLSPASVPTRVPVGSLPAKKSR